MADMHEATFSWPEVDANTVIVTGTFDQSSSVHLTKTPRGFEGKVKLPWGDRVLYKFIIDGRWVTAQSQPEEPDASGNLNNVYQCPSKPGPPAEPAQPSEPPSDLVESNREEKGNSPALAAALAPLTDKDTIAEKASQTQQTKDTAAATANDSLPDNIGSALKQVHAAVAVPILGAVKNVEGAFDAKDTVPPAQADLASNESEAAKVTAEQETAKDPPAVDSTAKSDQDATTEDSPENTEGQVGSIPEQAQPKGSGALAFVASNLGTAIHALTGVDPLNQDKIPIATPTPTHDTFEVRPQDQEADVQTLLPTTESETAISSTTETVPVENAVSPTTSILVPVEVMPVEPTPHAEAAATEPTSPVPVVPHNDIPPAPVVENLTPADNTLAEPTSLVPANPHDDTPLVPVVEDHTPAENTATASSKEEPAPALTRDAAFTVGSDITATQSVSVPPPSDEVATSASISRDDTPRPEASENIAPVAVMDTQAGAPTSEKKPMSTDLGNLDSNDVAQVESVAQVDPVAHAEPVTQIEPVTRVEPTAHVEPAVQLKSDEAGITPAGGHVPSTAEVPTQIATADARAEAEIAPSSVVEPSHPTETAAAIDNKAAEPIPASTPDIKPDTPDMAPPVAPTSPADPADTKETEAPSAEKAANGHSTTSASTPIKAAPKDSAGQHAFPTTSSTTSSPAASKHESARKKRTSIFGKVKHLFSSDKEDKKEKKK